ncbi:DUF6640 family protein [Parvibaculum sp.]|jgi:hypothetical protein|uniref:DUF6640 family protein n=1 Tax=Parvibaculum sp. TaxID=2024848 RepID=UPI000C56F619|nr:DUF6640 family protein [Parvibaculum sp.]HAC57325.1 hypothetical protein [Rhodobiaceae bacterium]MAU62580.1 hypothetical protein [Parvibaculum sp.]MBO6666480.1 hypothetical protein [Parvibaculum sp.]MBO6690925.1 hypothetical protein [Parvibaculum sp.]MBO6713101.1 hypothetical protein [Parvibaculum sp.]|tara:strand:- start:47 stop:496 length:450 start_codon:yes stop_codon:yes gene_type:complete
METTFDALLVPRLLFTVVAVMISVGPIFADFNKTHATNPLWTPHARFHVVWQVLSQTGVSLVILWLLWSGAADYRVHIWVAAILNYVWIASFYATLVSMPLYGGALKDVNGIKPFRFNIFGKIYLVDTNLFGSVILLIVNTIGVFLLAN